MLADTLSALHVLLVAGISGIATMKAVDAADDTEKLSQMTSLPADTQLRLARHGLSILAVGGVACLMVTFGLFLGNLASLIGGAITGVISIGCLLDYSEDAAIIRINHGRT